MKTISIYRYSLLFIAAIFLGISSTRAQVKIGANPSAINGNSVLELEDSAKGLLMPRLTTSHMNAMVGAPTGMVIFNTTDSALYMKRDTGWVIIAMAPIGVSPIVYQPVYADFYGSATFILQKGVKEWREGFGATHHFRQG